MPEKPTASVWGHPSVAVPRYTEDAAAHAVAFGWYSGESPSPMEAAYHFAELAERDPPNHLRYAAALEMFLASCWNICPNVQERAA